MDLSFINHMIDKKLFLPLQTEELIKIVIVTQSDLR